MFFFKSGECENIVGDRCSKWTKYFNIMFGENNVFRRRHSNEVFFGSNPFFKQ